MDLDEMIRNVQAALGVKGDGKPGPATWAAIHAEVIGRHAPSMPPVEIGGRVDDRSESCIATLHPRVQPYARSLVIKAAAAGITIKIISGLRTYEEQNKLFAKGRTAPGAKVTNARGGWFNHNFGIAFDVGVFSGAKYVEKSPLYTAVAAIGMDLGLECGASWKSFRDEPHYQLRPAWAAGMSESVMLAELRRRKAAGRDFFA